MLIEDLRNQYRTAHSRTFDENSLICSYCKQEYPEDKKEELRADFESHRAMEEPVADPATFSGEDRQ